MESKYNWLKMLGIILIFVMMVLGCDLPSADDVGDFELLFGQSEPYAPNSLFFKTGARSWREETYGGVPFYFFVFSHGTTLEGVKGIVLRRDPDDTLRFFVPLIGEKNSIFRIKEGSDPWYKYGIVRHK